MRTGRGIRVQGIILRVVVGLALTGPGTFPAAAGAAGEADSVAEVRVEGTRRVDPDAVLMVLHTKPGVRFSAETLEADVKEVYRLGYFEEVWVDREDTPDGIVLTFRLKERPWVREVQIEGKKKISEEKLQEVIKVKARQPLDIWAVEEDVEAIEKRYQEEGYYHAKAESRVEPLGEGEVKVVYQIQERRKVVIRTLSFSGNAAFSEADLGAVLESREYGGFSWLTGKGAFNREALEMDLERIRAHYLDWGYIQVKVAGPFLLFGPERDWVDVAFEVEEGEQFWVGKISIHGEDPLNRDDLFPELKTREGKVFSRSRLSEDIYWLTEQYSDLGYALANIDPVSRVDVEKKLVEIAFEVEKGDLVYFDRIRIEGNTKTRDKVIRRELKVKEGQLFSGSHLRESRRRVYALGFFEDVSIGTEPVGQEKMAITVGVKERPTGAASAGIGYSSVDRLVGTAQLSFGNLMGRGQKLRFITEFGSRKQTFDLGFQDPYFLDTQFGLNVNLYNTSREYTEYTQTDRGVSIRAGYLFTDYTRVHLGYRFDDVGLSDLEESVPWFFEGGKTSSVNFGFTRDTRDHPWDPTRGQMQSASVETAGGPLGGENEFIKFSLLGRIHFPLPLGSTLMLNGRIGYGMGFGGERLPFPERYFVGGLNSVRGYDYRSLGPEFEVPRTFSDPASLTTQVIRGGNKMIVLNAELLFPLIREAGRKSLPPRC